jgi:hypothetical protein
MADTHALTVRPRLPLLLLRWLPHAQPTSICDKEGTTGGRRCQIAMRFVCQPGCRASIFASIL